ncbi:MAG: metallophosphoesterase [Spirochaetales bacterium]|jgi:predicted phosphodiesterase|nr:metallophosphoesterase [Spirochaetales bacterium]
MNPPLSPNQDRAGGGLIKRLALGDLHGRDSWKRYVDEEYTEFYILGDYFDSYDLSFSAQQSNFKALCGAARKNPRIKLCLGNHDYHYLKNIPPGEQYSGFQEKHHPAIQKILEENIDLLKIVYLTRDNYLISHAGITCTFMQRLKVAGVAKVEDINQAFLRDRRLFRFYGQDPFGNDVTQGPLWVRPDALVRDAVPGYIQIVGHTEKKDITRYAATNVPGEPRASPSGRTESFIFIDTGDKETILRF